MNDQTNESIPPNPQDQPGEQGQAQAPHPNASEQQSEPTDQGACLLDSLRSAFRKGAKDAKETAQKAAPKARTLAAQLAYGMAYGVAFGAVFPYTLVERLAPDCMRAGWNDGTSGGRDSANRAAEGMKQQGEPKPSVTDVGSPEPGTAS